MPNKDHDPLHHCMIVHAYYPIGEPRVQREAEALVEAGYQVDVLCLRQPGEAPEQVVNNVRAFRLPMRRFKGQGTVVQFLEYLAFFLLAFWRVSLLHFRQHYQVVQVHNLPDFLVFAALVPRLFGARIILDLHDLMPEFYASRFDSGLDNWPVRLVMLQELLSCRFAHRVITVTEPWRRTLIQRGVPPEKCYVVMNLADTHLFRKDTLPEHTPTDPGLLLFYHGNLTYRYGVDLVLQAVACLKSELPSLRLTIHGRGEFLAELQHQVQELGLEGCVHISSGYMPIEELPAFIAQADLGLVPYRQDIFTDGILPTKLMEYAALGIPAVVARSPAIEAYFDSTMVEFFSPGSVDELVDCIRRLYHDRSRLKELASGIYQFNQHYNWDLQKKDYIHLVESLSGRGY